jgi:hypothetical protein
VEVAMVYFKTVSQYLPRGTKGHDEKTKPNSGTLIRCAGCLSCAASLIAINGEVTGVRCVGYQLDNSAHGVRSHLCSCLENRKI